MAGSSLKVYLVIIILLLYVSFVELSASLSAYLFIGIGDGGIGFMAVFAPHVCPPLMDIGLIISPAIVAGYFAPLPAV
jgi:hypothetical protein